MRKWLVSLICVALFSWGPADDAYAAGSTADASIGTASAWCFGLIGMTPYNPIIPSALVGSPANGQNGIISPLVECFTDTNQGIIPSVTRSFMTKTKPTYLKVIGAMFLLSIVYYGLRLMTGDIRMPKAETFILVLKIAGVILFLNNANYIYTEMVSLIQQLSQIVGKAATNAHNNGFCIGDGASASAPVAVPPTTTTSLWQQGLWQRWDCIFSFLLGFSATGFAAGSIAAFLMLMLTSVSNGILVFLFTLGMLLFLLTTAFRFIHVYLMSILALSFMFCIGYIFVPLLLFRGMFYDYFRKWLMMVFGYIITPIIMIAFMGMMLVALDIAIFSGQYSVFCEIGGPLACGGTVNRTVGAKLFSNITSNMDISGMKSGIPNTNLKGSFAPLFYVALDGLQSVNITGGVGGDLLGAGVSLFNPEGASDPNCKLVQDGGGGFTCQMQQSTGGNLTGSTTDNTIHPLEATVGINHQALNLKQLASNAGSYCIPSVSSSWGSSILSATVNGSATTNPVITYACPWIENIIIAVCVVLLLIYITASVLNFIPTLTSNLTKDLVAADPFSKGSKLITSAIFGESGGKGMLDSAMSGSKDGKGALSKAVDAILSVD